MPSSSPWQRQLMRNKRGNKPCLLPPRLMLLCCPLRDHSWVPTLVQLHPAVGAVPYEKHRGEAVYPQGPCAAVVPLCLHMAGWVRRGNGHTKIGKNLSVFKKGPKWNQDPSMGPQSQVGCAGLAQGCWQLPGHKDGSGRLMETLPSLLQVPTASVGTPMCYLQQKF